MKKVILLFFVLMMFGCGSTRHFVNVERRNNYYQHHRYNTYTAPTWVPGFGILLETRIYKPYSRFRQPVLKRKHR
jgi:uncharacterized protein YceK